MKVAIVLAMVQAAAFATTIQVPGDYATIQDAINAAANGDTVLVAPGTYAEDIDFIGKAITVKSSGGSSVTEIAGTGSSSVVTFQNYEGRDSVLDGFTVRNGDPNGIRCLDSTPMIVDNRIRDHAASGIHCTAPSFHEGPLIMYNTVSENGGDGITENCDSVIRNNVISKNQKYGIRGDEYSDAVIMSNTIAGNHSRGIYLHYGNRSIIAKNLIYNHVNVSTGGGGIWASNAYPEIYGNFIFNNSTTGVGGGIWCDHHASCRIANNLIWNNKASEGGGIYLRNESYCTLINNTIVENTATVMGGGVGIANYTGLYSPETSLKDCILWDNQAPSGPEVSIDLSSLVRMSHCNVEGGQASVHILSGVLYWEMGMIDSDPLFVDPATGDFRLQQDPCQPGITNPCVDAGSSFSMNLNLHEVSTRTDGVPDGGMADMGIHLGDYLPPVWRADAHQISAATGGTVSFHLNPGFGYSGRNYLVLGSVSGIVPGTPLPGGLAVLPLNWDVFTDIALSLVNTPAFQEFMGTSPMWKNPILQTGPLPGAAGVSLYFAYTMNNPFDFASHPMRIEIVP